MFAFEDVFTKPRAAAKSYSELLPWFGQITPSLILCKDGSLLAGYSYPGEDVEGKEDEEVDKRIDMLESALSTFNDRITIWNVQERRFTKGYPRGDFSNPVAYLVDRQWEVNLSKSRNATITQTLWIGYRFPNLSEAFFESLANEIRKNDGNVISALKNVVTRRLSERSAISQVRGQLADMAGEFEKLLSAFTGFVEHSLGFKRLEGRNLLGELYSRANLASPRGPVDLADDQLHYLNTTLATDKVVRRGDMFEFSGLNDKKFVAAMSATGMPKHAFADHIDKLMSTDGEYILVQCFRFEERLKSEKVIQDAEMFYRSEVKSVMTRVFERLFDQVSEKENTGNLYLAADAQDALVELTADDIAYGWYNATILAIGSDRKQAQDAIDAIGGKLRTSGFTLVREEKGLLPALLTSMPGSNATLRWKFASVANVADLAPIRTISRGEDTHPLFSRVLGREVPPHCRFLTQHGISFDFNTHAEDLGHTAIIGGSGAGKTTLVTLLTAQFRKYSPAQCFVFDKDYSLMPATVLLGGKHIDLGPKSKNKRMNPVRIMMLANDDLRLRQWIEVLITAGGNEVNSSEGATIYSAIQGLRRSPPSAWRLSAIYALIRGEDPALAAKMAPYVDLRDDDDDYGTGPYAAYFDNDEDSFTLSDMVGMECGGILESPQLASPFMDYAFYCVEKALDGSTPTMIYIEEAWYMMKNPTFLSRLEDWLRTFRKKRAFVVFATQALDELANLPNIGSFITNIPTQIFLPSINSSVFTQAKQYEAVFGTTWKQLEILNRAIPKRDYLLVKPNVTRLVSTEMPSSIIAMNEAVSSEDKREKLLQYAAEGRANWQIAYMKEVLNVEF